MKGRQNMPGAAITTLEVTTFKRTLILVRYQFWGFHIVKSMSSSNLLNAFFFLINHGTCVIPDTAHARDLERDIGKQRMKWKVSLNHFAKRSKASDLQATSPVSASDTVIPSSSSIC